MQTLTVGSFLNLENASTVEALKFTARRLAEMTTATATAENLNAEALKNLANDLWQKADYVARNRAAQLARKNHLLCSIGWLKEQNAAGESLVCKHAKIEKARGSSIRS